MEFFIWIVVGLAAIAYVFIRSFKKNKEYHNEYLDVEMERNAEMQRMQVEKLMTWKDDPATQNIIDQPEEWESKPHAPNYMEMYDPARWINRYVFVKSILVFERFNTLEFLILYLHSQKPTISSSELVIKLGVPINTIRRKLNIVKSKDVQNSFKVLLAESARKNDNWYVDGTPESILEHWHYSVYKEVKLHRDALKKINPDNK